MPKIAPVQYATDFVFFAMKTKGSCNQHGSFDDRHSLLGLCCLFSDEQFSFGAHIWKDQNAVTF